MTSHPRNIDFANIAFSMPTQFMQVYQSMDESQCELLVDSKNSKGQSVIDIFENQDDKVKILIYIFEKLNSEKIYNICSVQDSNGKTLLHRLASRNGKSSLLDVIFQGLFPENLSKLLMIQDNSKKTILHHQNSRLNIGTLVSVFDNELMNETLNKVCAIQDNEKRTILHYIAMSAGSFSYIDFIIDKLTPEVFNNIINLRDKKKNHFMGYFSCNNRIAEKYAIHLKCKEKCKALGNSENYLKCIASILSPFHRLNTYRREYYCADEYKPDIENMIKLANDIIFEMQIPIEYLAQEDNYYFIALADVLLLSLKRSKLKPETLAPLREQVENILISLLKKIPSSVFTNTYRRIYATRGTDLFEIGELLVDADYLPGVDTDPLEMVLLFRIKIQDRPFKTRISQYLSLLFDDTYVLQKPKEFLEFYQKIINHQVGLQNKFNRGYVQILQNNLDTVRNRNLERYPDTDNMYSECQKQIQIMLTILNSLTMHINSEAALNLRVNANMTPTEALQSADFCSQASDNASITPALKLRLQVMALRFYHYNARQLLNSMQPPVVPDEKEEKIQGLDDDIAPPQPIDADADSIVLLNTKINVFLNLPTNEIKHNEIDEDNYNKAIKKYSDDLNKTHSEEWQIHPKEFGEYIRERATKRSRLISYTNQDYQVRKAYYDIITSKDSCLADLYKKIEIINLAANDPRLTKGYKHHCLNFLNKLKFDFYIRAYLLENKDTLTKGFQLDDDTISPDNYGKQLSINELANIAFHLKNQFHLIYPSMTAAQCNEIIEIKDTTHKNIIDHYPSDIIDIKFLTFLIANLTEENINKICLKRDKYNRTLLHKLASQSGHNHTLELIYKKISPVVLAVVLETQDNHGKTPLHYRESTCSLETFKTVLSNPLLANRLNDVCTLQDSAGETFLHHFALNDKPRCQLTLDFAKKLTNPLREIYDKNLKTHLKEFEVYITNRANAKPSLFRNSVDDYNHRRGYYDIIIIEDQSIEVIKRKLNVLNQAVNDKKLKSIISHRCLDILKKLKTDYENISFLYEFEKDLPGEALEPDVRPHVNIAL